MPHSAAVASSSDSAAPPFVGRDGYGTLALSCAVIIASLGVSLAAVFWHVARVAATASDAPPLRPRILVLGMQLKGGAIAPAYRRRLERGLALWRAEPAAEIVVLGGRRAGGPRSEAEAGRDWLLGAGVPPRRIALEEGSRHTLENLRAYREAFPPAPALLVTNRFHLARSALMARGLGITHLPCAAEAEFRASPLEVLRLAKEAFLVHWYLAGRSYARWTGNRRMTARIS